MQRRHVLAGVASVGTLAGAGLSITGGLSRRSDVEPADPVTLNTIDAPGSRDGEVTIPATDRPTFVDFFATWCDPCVEQMPALAEANDRVDDSVLFISVTTEAVGESVAEETIVEWWRKYNGDWLLGADPSIELSSSLGVSPRIPTAVAIDDTGRVQWSESGVHTADELLDGIETIL
ncbi:Redoxin [Halopenitus malekzadehii]|uniref:Redoxin n=1 Tax=Halopenitus malekzadehii TaxID=1267564 RepID=A0A1H6JAU8_9EURY|nr:TlpA disulfide reductase family protein [Halopenitus malekzadehii]SEH57500.1 Redoxin [Halopenitus malekzadehii]